MFTYKLVTKKKTYRLADTIEKSQKQGVEGQVIELN